ncbi:Uncharacterised protein [Bacillus tequilensis]|nr:Uncharacterised protein [Bacillus tequilensis]
MYRKTDEETVKRLDFKMEGHEEVILTKEDKPSNRDQKRADNLDSITSHYNHKSLAIL